MAHIERNQVESNIQNGYSFDFGKYLSEGFTIFGKEWLMFSLYGFVSILILAFSAITVVGFVFLLYPTLLGFSVTADKVVKGEKLEFNDFFGAYKNFGSHAVLGLIFVGLYVLAVAPYFYVVFWSIEAQGSVNPSFWGMGLSMVFMLVMILVLYISQILLFYAPYLIHYGNYSSSEAIQKSISLAKKKFWWFLLLVFITGMIANLGQYACFIGMFATIPIAFIINYTVVKHTLMTNEYSEIDQIGSN